MTEKQQSLVTREMRRLSVNGGKTGEAVREILANKSVRPVDLVTIKDGDVFSLPTSWDVFGIQMIRGNEAPYFMVNIKRGGTDVAVPVYLSQLNRAYFSMKNDDFETVDGQRVMVHSEGPIFDLIQDIPTLEEVCEKLIELGNKKDTKQLKVVKRVVPIMAYDFKNEVYKPKQEQSLYDFEWV